MARASHSVNPARRLRSGAWLLQRSWRHPHRLPAGWRSERFAHAVEQARSQLRPIHTLAALADSFARESQHVAQVVLLSTMAPCRRFGEDPLEIAYVTRWIELEGGRELRAWQALCQAARS